MSRARLHPREARSILTRTGGYLSGYTHTLQPYAGCEFSCRYCYVREMAVQKTNPTGLPWSHWISPKTNAPELLERIGRRGGLAAARIFCSSSTDPYTPIERRFALTRACLDVFAVHPPAALVIQTRSPLVLRDAERIARLPRTGVSFTITTDDEKLRRLLEPDSPRFSRRLETLRALHDAGVRTQAAVSPILPGDPQRLAEMLAPIVDRVVLDDFFRGDGAGGRRSRAALELLRAQGELEACDPRRLDRVAELFARVLGPERVAVSQPGFNDLAWLGVSAPA